MASSIRLSDSGAPDTPPAGYARIYVEEFENKLYLKMKRPDGTVEVFGTLNIPISVEKGGTGLNQVPSVGQILIGTNGGYRLGDITAGNGINIIKDDSTFEISANLSNINISMPIELDVDKTSTDGQTSFNITKKTQSSNTVYAAPNDVDGVPTFRFLQVNDIPDLPITKIINLIETIRAESLLVPIESDDISHEYDNLQKTLTSTLKPTNVTSGDYGSSTKTLQINVKVDGRIDDVTEINIAIPSSQITDFNEAVQNQVGTLIVDSTTVNAEYNDYENTLKLHVNEEILITTNISENENVRAPTSQAIKQYVDDNLTAERNARIAEDTELQNSITALETQVGENLQQALENINTSITTEISARTNADELINERLDAFFQNAPEVLNTIVEINDRFNEIELSIAEGAESQAQSLEDEVQRINIELSSLREGLEDEISARLNDIDTVSAEIVDEANARIENDEITLNLAKAYTNSSISAIVDSAPELLNTLKELSNALGGDANFATTISNQFTQVTIDINEETSSRIAADNALDERLDIIQGADQGSIVKAQLDAQSYADDAVLVEKTRAEGIESQLQSDIDDLVDGLAQEVLDRTNAVLAETNRAIAVETGFDGRLNTIEGTGPGSIVKAETDAKSYADGIVLTEKTRAELAESDLNDKIIDFANDLTTEIATRTTADNTLQQNIDNETAARLASQTTLLNTAKSYTDSKVAELVNSAPEVLDTLKELSDALGGDENFATTITNRISVNENNLSSEVSRAIAKENKISDDLIVETNNRIQQDNLLQFDITTVSNSLSNEITNRSNADVELQLNIDGVAQNLDQEILNRQTAIAVEKTRAESVESLLRLDITTLQSNLTQEIENRTAGDTALNLAIVTEISDRQTADLLLQSNLNTVDDKVNKEISDRIADVIAEKTRAEGVESSIAEDLATEVNDRIDAIAKEVLDRNAAIELAVTQSIIPRQNETYDLGSPEFRFKDLYLSGNSIILGDAVIGSDNGILDLPAEATISGTPIASTSYVDAELNAEELARITADNLLQHNIDDEENARELADANLQTEINNERTERISSDSALELKINTEISDRQTADELIDGRLLILEGDVTVPGSVAKAEYDAKQYADLKISQLIDGAPQLLDTLNEISAAIGDDENFITTINTAISTVQSNLNTEIDARQTADTILESSIATEKLRAEAVELNLNTVIVNEITARSNADTDLQNQISAEVLRAISQDQDLADSITVLENTVNTTIANAVSTLQTNLATETSARIAADNDLQFNITVESNRANNAEIALQHSILAEIAARQAGDVNTLNNAQNYTNQKLAELLNSAPTVLDTLKELADAINNDANFATTIFNEINSVDIKIDSEITRATFAESGLQTLITNEVYRAQTAETVIQNALNSEIARAQIAEANLQTSINAIEAVVGVDILEAVTQFQTELATETSARQNADVVLQTNINNEETARINAISTLTTNLNTEILNRQTFDATLESNLNSEISLRISADSALSARLLTIEGTGEGSIAKAKADSLAYTDSKVAELVNSAPELLNTLNELANALGGDANFATTVANQISLVQTNVIAEQNRAIASETALSTAISTEITARQASDAAIFTNIGALSDDFEQKLEQEITNRQTQDATIESALAAEITSRIAGDAITLTSANQYTDSKIAEILGTAPEILDTIQEINNALGNDANFAVNVNNQITTLQNNLNNEISRAQLAESDFQAQLDQLRLLYGKDLQPYKEDFVITQVDLNNGYVQLSTRSVVLNSVIAWVDRLGIFEGVDYQLESNTEQNWLRLVFSGNLIGQNQQSLEIGDVIHVNYLIADGDELQEAVNQINSDILTETQNRIESDTQINNRITGVENTFNSNLQSAVEELSQRISRGTMTPAMESFTITSQNVLDNYVQLTAEFIVENSVTATLNRVNMFEGIDFTIQKTIGGTNRLVFSNAIPVEVGEYLRVNYLESESNDLLVYPHYDNYVLSQTDINNNYLTLTKPNIMRESIQVFVDRVPLLQEIDFLISINTNQQSILTFIGDVLPNQALAFESGENIRVNYLYRP